jgi:hypothetical protein
MQADYRREKDNNYSENPWPDWINTHAEEGVKRFQWDSKKNQN